MKIFISILFILIGSQNASAQNATPPQGNCPEIDLSAFSAEFPGARLYSCNRVDGLLRVRNSAQPGYVLVVVHSPAGGQLASDPRGITVYWKRQNKTTIFSLDDLGSRVLGFRYQQGTSRVEQKNYVIGDVNGDGYIDVALATTTETAGISELYILSVNWLDAEQDLALKELIPYVQYADGLRAEHNNDGTFIISNDSPAGSLVKDNGEVIVGPSRYQWDVSERKYILNQNRNPQSTPAAAKKKK